MPNHTSPEKFENYSENSRKFENRHKSLGNGGQRARKDNGKVAVVTVQFHFRQVVFEFCNFLKFLVTIGRWLLKKLEGLKTRDVTINAEAIMIMILEMKSQTFEERNHQILETKFLAWDFLEFRDFWTGDRQIGSSSGRCSN